MGVQKDQRADSHSSGGSIGDSMSPTTRKTPFSRPMKSSTSSSTGTNLATGLPRFVISNGRLVARTSSIKLRHLALNARQQFSSWTHSSIRGHIQMTTYSPLFLTLVLVEFLQEPMDI